MSPIGCDNILSYLQKSFKQERGHVLFSDESIQSDSRRVFTWRESGARFHPHHISKSDRFRGKGILVCGGIMLGSRTPLYVFDARTLNSQRYMNGILQVHMRFFWVWVPSHVEIPDNERADQKAKQVVESSQPVVSLTLRRSKSVISTCIDKCTAVTQETKSLIKPWETLVTVAPILRHLERAEAVACFCLTTGSQIFTSVWRSIARFGSLDGDHLLQFSGLNEWQTNDGISGYWDARY
ncbi:reverse transcriptase [Trichonephila clavipes]|nr:reverse transcriptase [Trichonephila clavipes]